MAAPDSLSPGQFFHGTVKAGLRDVMPAASHGQGVIFPHDTSREHAYAASSEADAWDYAEKAWHASGRGVPHVYEVTPHGEHEADPSHTPEGVSRSNFSGDRRSTHGWKVKREVPMPEDMGTPSDWR